MVSLFTALPGAFVTVLAGLALLGAIANNLAAAMADTEHREAALVAFIVTASGVSFCGLSSAFWGIVVGYLFYRVLRRD
ncbi:MAG: hypothetical protein CMI11_02185 [Oceanospirillales bacterium]|nr:hypothetical protein [Oceanospirillales bacterium]